MKKLIFTAIIAILATSTGCTSGPQFGKMFDSFPNPLGNRSEQANNDASFGIRMAKGRNQESTQQWDKAIATYKTLSKEFPKRGEVFQRLGVCLDKVKRFPQAQVAYTTAIQLDPTNSELFNDLGYSFFLHGQLAKAESALRKALIADPSEARFHNNLGMVLGHQKRYEEALREFSMGGSEAEAYYNLAFIYATKKLEGQAIACFKMSLAADPTFDMARDSLASFQRTEVYGDELLPLVETSRDGVQYVPYVEGFPSPNGMPTAEDASPNQPASFDQSNIDGFGDNASFQFANTAARNAPQRAQSLQSHRSSHLERVTSLQDMQGTYDRN
ncbi:MAG: Tfp pilus assembly protein PilF [Pirellulaceae bacterium]|jgi:Tfp pilus assembly protein PilF